MRRNRTPVCGIPFRNLFDRKPRQIIQIGFGLVQKRLRILTPDYRLKRTGQITLGGITQPLPAFSRPQAVEQLLGLPSRLILLVTPAEPGFVVRGFTHQPKLVEHVLGRTLRTGAVRFLESGLAHCPGCLFFGVSVPKHERHVAVAVSVKFARIESIVQRLPIQKRLTALGFHMGNPIDPAAD